MAQPRGHMWDPVTQTLPRGDIEALQQRRLEHLGERIWETPLPFWRRKLEAGGFAPGDVLGLEDLARVPVTVKDELRRSEAEHPPFGDYRGAPLKDCIRVGSTGGTSGVPTFALWTRADLDDDETAAARMFWRQGLRPGFVLANAHPLGVYGGGRSLTSALEAFGCLVLAVGSLDTEAELRGAIDLWRRCPPLAYQIFPATYVKVYEAAVELGLDPAGDLNLHPPVEHPDGAERTITGGTEGFAFLGSACPEGGGAHAAEDRCIVEVLGDDGLPVPDGEMGLFTITTINRDNFVLRYNVEDYVVVNPEHGCPCGETHRRVRWQGRRKDRVFVGDEWFLPGRVARVIFADEAFRTPTMEYQVVRRRENDRLHVRVEMDSSRFGAAAPAAVRLAAALEASLGVPASVDVVGRGTLPRPPYKPERVVDE
ncbi:MAG: hypothetical protein K1X95_06445 [Acidimicrobiia bacterium]|nr:hypothetical protein [Acidimicrobiia bacterium]